MLELGAASDDQVVLAFLRADMQSPKWRMNYLPPLQALRLDPKKILELANLSDPAENWARKLVLGAVRGYGRDEWLFKDFPPDVTWRRVMVEPSDFERLKYVGREMEWLKLSENTRRVEDGARNLDANRRIADDVRAAELAIQQGRVIDDLILVDADGDLIVVEGHTRATAFVRLSEPFRAFIGTSPQMGRWAFV